MIRIAVIDDDFQSESLIDYLQWEGYDARRYKSADTVLTNLEEVSKMDVVVLDVMMESPPTIPPERSHGGYNTGVHLAQELRRRSPQLRLLILSGTNNVDVANYCHGLSNCVFLSKWSMPSLRQISATISSLLGDRCPEPPSPFIVHGRDEATLMEVRMFLEGELGFQNSIVLRETPNSGKTIIEKLEDSGLACSVVFVLLTPDDGTVGPGADNIERRRARQNVIFEMGYFMGTLGRRSGRVILLHKGPLELPSDLSGVVYIDISDGVRRAGEDIRREVRAALGTRN